MLTSLSPAVTADEMSAKPTVEEILSEYHRNAFESRANGDTETSSTWSHRNVNAKTLEQETVDTLNNAGYEAYIVTTDNYETLEAELKTDFNAMGLDPNGEYIVVISGANQAETNSAATLTALVDDPYTQRPVRQYSGQYSNTRYSSKYHNESQRITEAIDHYDRVHSSISLDYIYSVDFFFKSAEGEILWDTDGTPLFTHNRSFSIPLHSFD